jgi:hypothetical protein
MAYMKDSKGRRLDSFEVTGVSDVGTPASVPATPIVRDVDSTYNVNNALLVPVTVNKKRASAGPASALLSRAVTSAGAPMMQR